MRFEKRSRETEFHLKKINLLSGIIFLKVRRPSVPPFRQSSGPSPSCLPWQLIVECPTKPKSQAQVPVPLIQEPSLSWYDHPPPEKLQISP